MLRKILAACAFASLLWLIALPAQAYPPTCPQPAGVTCGGTATFDPDDCETNCGVAWCMAIDEAYAGYAACKSICDPVAITLGWAAYELCLEVNGCRQYFENECSNQTEIYDSCMRGCSSGWWDSDTVT